MMSAHENDGLVRPPAISFDRLPRVLWCLLLVNVLLLAGHLLSFMLRGRVLPFLDLDAESTVASWWSSAQLLLAAVTLGFVALRNAAVSPAALPLALLALLVLAMSADETAAVHEWVGKLLDSMLGDRTETAFHHSGLWFAVIGIPFAVVVVLILRRLAGFLVDVPGTGLRLLSGFATLLAGAVVVEGVTNLLIPEGLGRLRIEHGPYVALSGLEEFLEMCGGSLLLWASLGLFRNHWSTRGAATELRPLTAAEVARQRAAGEPHRPGNP